jgi:hypothetical protein
MGRTLPVKPCLLLNGFANELTGGFVGVPEGKQPRLDLLFGKIPAMIATGQTGQTQGERQQSDELFITLLHFVGVSHSEAPCVES